MDFSTAIIFFLLVNIILCRSAEFDKAKWNKVLNYITIKDGDRKWIIMEHFVEPMNAMNYKTPGGTVLMNRISFEGLFRLPTFRRFMAYYSLDTLYESFDFKRSFNEKRVIWCFDCDLPRNAKDITILAKNITGAGVDGLIFSYGKLKKDTMQAMEFFSEHLPLLKWLFIWNMEIATDKRDFNAMFKTQIKSRALNQTTVILGTGKFGEEIDCNLQIKHCQYPGSVVSFNKENETFILNLNNTALVVGANNVTSDKLISIKTLVSSYSYPDLALELWMVTDDGLPELFSIFARNEKIKHTALAIYSGGFLTPSGIEELFDRVIATPKIHALAVAGTITDNSASKVVELLKADQLASLVLMSFYLTDAGLKKIAPHLKTPSILEFIVIETQEATNEGAKALAVNLENTSIKSFTLVCGMNVTDEAGIVFHDTIRTKYTAIEFIELGGVNALSKTFFIEMYRIVKGFRLGKDECLPEYM